MKKMFTILTIIGAILTTTPIVSAEISKEQKQSHVVVLLGPPASGKGSQAALIKEKYNLPHISTGDLLRENVKGGTDLGKEAKTFMETGKLVPDALIINMIFERVSKEDCMSGFILDGFPRTIEQAKALDAKLSSNQNLITVNFNVSDSVLIERIAGRMVCQECSRPYNMKYAPPKKENVCDDCSGTLYVRSDDTKEVFLERLKVYREQTEPLLSYYGAKKILRNIESEKSKEAIFNDVTKVLPE